MPPEKVAVTVPVGTPLQVRSVLVRDRDSATGLTMVTVWLVWHRLASCSVTVCDPVARGL